MEWKNQLTKTPYLVLFIILISVGVGTASAAITITLAGDVDVTGNLDVIGTITGQTITNLQNQINAAGISAETETQIDDIEEDITSSTFGLEEIKNEVRFIEENVTDPVFGLEEIKTEVTNIESSQYVPFKAQFANAKVCDAAGGASLSQDKLIIDSDGTGTFMVDSIQIVISGNDQATDQFNVDFYSVDGGATMFIATEDLTGTSTNDLGFEIMGATSFHGGIFCASNCSRRPWK